MKKKMKLEQNMESKRDKKISLSVVTVTYNEKENIKLFIEAIDKVFLDNNTCQNLPFAIFYLWNKYHFLTM